MSDRYTLHVGDCREWLRTLPSESVQCCVTSPPYFGLRDYSSCGCSLKRHASKAFLSSDGAERNGEGTGPCTPNDARCRKPSDPECDKCGGTGKVKGMGSQIGLESTPDSFITELTGVFREVRRVLRKDGTCWVNMGDSYANDAKFGGTTGGKHAKGLHGESGLGREKKTTGMKPKELVGIPWRLAFAMQDEGWTLRQDIIWSKNNPMPESVTDRCTKSHEYLFLLTKSARYYWNHAANQEPAACAGQGRGGSTNRYEQNAAGMDNREYETRNRRSVWTIQPASYSGAHFAVFPEELVRPCIELGSRPGDIILEPFAGSGTTPAVAVSMGREAWACELNPAYAELIRRRMRGVTPPLFSSVPA